MGKLQINQNKSFIRGFIIGVIFILLLAAGFLGKYLCMLPAPTASVEPTNAQSTYSKPKAHVWQYIFSGMREEIGYATYSYILAGRDERNHRVKEVYDALVSAIVGSTPHGIRLDGVAKSNLNIFIIPAKKGFMDDRHVPNYELSKRLLAFLAATGSAKFNRPGPYIITVYQPLFAGIADEKQATDILYLDLTDANPVAMPEVVRVYKEKLQDDRLDGVGKLESLRLDVLNFLLTLEDNVGFVRVAWAKFRDTFESK